MKTVKERKTRTGPVVCGCLNENAKLTRLVADLSLDEVMLQDVVRKVLKPVKQREVMQYLMGLAAPICVASDLSSAQHSDNQRIVIR